MLSLAFGLLRSRDLARRLCLRLKVRRDLFLRQRRQEHGELTAFQDRLLVNGSVVGDCLRETIEKLESQTLVSHLAAPKFQADADLVPRGEEADRIVDFRFEVMRVDTVGQLDFLDLHDGLLLLLLFLNGIAACLREKKADILDAALLITIAFGLFMGLFNAQEGVSQLYYTLASYIPGAVFGFRHLKPKQGRIQQTILVMAIVLFGIQCSWFFGRCGVASAMKSGFNTVFSESDAQRNEKQPYSIQKTDYDALVWVRENTPVHAVLASDRSVLCELDNYMYYGTFSERQMYLEGDRYFYSTHVEERAHRRQILSEAYNDDAEAITELKKEGVSYILQTKWIASSFSGSGCVKVFETDSINVWEIKQ